MDEWKAERYAKNADFVPALGRPVVNLLAPKAGERILDLGCGDGVLTAQIAETGAIVTGIDASPDMIAAARRRGLDARVIDGQSLAFAGEFDAVFSNAAIHWMANDPGAVIAGVKRALKPGGRFVAEMGGHGNIAAIVVAMMVVAERHGLNPDTIPRWYFPTVDEYRSQLVSGGFAVDYIELIPRPTPLATGMAAWMETFGRGLLDQLDGEERAAARDEVVELLAPVLRDGNGNWTADYVRLRFSARALR